MTPADFIAKWGPGGPAHSLSERAGAQPHFIDLCRLLGVPEPGAVPGEDYVFEQHTLLLGEAPWPAAWQVWPLAPERIGPVLSPRHARFAALRDGPPRALLDEPLLHTASRPQAWPRWLASQQLADAPHLGTGFDHLTYLLEAAVAGLGVAIADETLVEEDIRAGRLVRPFATSIKTGASYRLVLREAPGTENGLAAFRACLLNRG